MNTREAKTLINGNGKCKEEHDTSVAVVVSFQVEDLDEWKAVFDSDVNNRETSGIHETAYRELDDSHRVQVIGTALSRQAF